MFTFLLANIGGPEDRFSLEHRVFNLMAFLVTIFAIIGTVVNLLLSISFVVNILSVIGILSSLLILFISRVRGVFNETVMILYTLLAVLILVFLFLFNGGTEGPLTILLVMLLHILIVVAPQRTQIPFFLIITCALIGLYFLEYFVPQIITVYDSREVKFADIIITATYSCVFVAFTTILFKKNYNKERSIVLKQNEELKKLNHRVEDQKTELRNKTRLLELSISQANERNEFIETLMKELNHRVKNNLQIITSLLNLQSKSIKDKKAREAIIEGKNRLLAMILIHQRLYKTELLTEVDMKDYVAELSENIVNAYSNETNQVQLKFDLQAHKLKVEQAVPMGLIINELLTNCMKHAFSSEIKNPSIFLMLKQTEEGLQFKISDNGIGLTPEVDPSTGGFGLELVYALVRQLDGTINSDRDNGTSFEIFFKPTEN